MTEDEWLACDDPDPMVKFLKDKATDRKFRLFACGCCRHVWPRITDPRSWTAVEMAERVADGLIPQDQLIPHYEAASEAARSFPERNDPAWAAAETATVRTRRKLSAWRSAESVALTLASGVPCAALLRCVFGNPFRPVTLDPSWLTSTVLSLAEGMYESRDFSAMPILADALGDAGCEDEAILAHCRGNSPHCRGCDVIDAILGES